MWLVNDLQKAFQRMTKRLLPWLEHGICLIFPERAPLPELSRVPREICTIKNDTLEIFPVFSYRLQGIRRAIWRLKYKNDRNAAKILAGFLYEEIVAEISEQMIWNDFRNPILVPIPLSDERRKERGYNQTENLLREIVACARSALTGDTELIKKIRHTQPQTKLSRRDRQKNLKGCFAVADEGARDKIQGRNIILIDDVTTTGSTLNEAARTFKKHGAKQVIAFTVAHQPSY